MANQTEYGILDNGVLRYGPNAVTVRYNPTPVSWFTEHGYKRVIDTPYPTEEPAEGYHWESHWEDGEVITKVWEQVQNPPEPEPEPDIEDEG